jgi:hypothetical protein
MRALIWKRINESHKKISKVILFFLFPVLYFGLLYFTGVQWNSIVAYFPFNVITFSVIIHFSIEELVSCEVILATNTSILKLWFINIVFVTITGFIYSIFLLFAFGLILKFALHKDIALNIYTICQSFLNLFMSAALIAGSTIHFADYTLHKQLIASVFAVLGFVLPVLFVPFGNLIPINSTSIITSVVASALLFLISAIIIYNTNKEKLLINTSSIVKAWETKTIDE